MEFTKEEKDKTTKELIKATQSALAKGNRILKAKGKTSIPKIEVNVDDLKGTTAGQAYLVSKVIRFNLDMAILNGRDFINEIPVHEVAHIIANELDGSEGHDNTWKNVMTQMGLSPTRLHEFKTTATDYLHLCPKCMSENEISQTVYDNIKTGTKEYTCKKCGRDIKLRDIIKKEF